jgi:hypothetical protein
MADNAPFSANRAPYPNVHVNLPGRIEQYLLTLAGTNGAVALTTASSSGGCTATYVAEGEYSFTFPAGGTGAIGWIQIMPAEVSGQTAGDARAFNLDSDDVSFPNGTGTFTAVTVSGGSEALADIIGTVRLLVSVLRAPS